MADNQVVIVDGDTIEVTTSPDPIVNIVDVAIQGPAGASIGGVPIYLQASAPTSPPSKYIWYKIVGSDVEIWIEDGS